MKLFISWSGTVSQKIALVLRDWIPTVIQSIETWVSAEDIAKGARWNPELSKALEESTFGIICVVPGNLEEPWLNFEAGVISRSLETAHVCPFIFGLAPKQVTGPLGQFQCTEYAKNDIRKLIDSLNKANPSGPIPTQRLNQTFDLCWPILKSSLDPLATSDLPLEGGRITYLKGKGQIYSHALRLYESAQQRVRVLQFFGGPRPPVEYAEEAAKILKKKREFDIEVTFDAYLAIDFSKIPPNFERMNRERLGIYKKHGVLDLVSLHLLEMHYPTGFGFDIFIVDSEHAHISFSTSERLEKLQRGIAFENQGSVVRDIVEWFERAVARTAIPYEEYLKQKTK